MKNTNSGSSKVKPYKGLPMEGPIARWYAKNTRGHDDYQSLARQIAERVPEGSHILEVAPGPGYLAIEIARLGHFQVTGLDISKTFVQIAQANSREAGVEVDFRLGDVAQMPFADNTFDLILCRAAFKNFSTPVNALNEMYRVLKPNGHASIFDMRRDASSADIDAEVKKMALDPVNSFFTRWTFHQVLRKSAYTKAEIQEFVVQTPFRRCDIQEGGLGFEIRLVK